MQRARRNIIVTRSAISSRASRIEAGFSPKRLQTLLGHASITMTYDVYGHLFPNPEDDHARFAAIERAVTGVKGA